MVCRWFAGGLRGKSRAGLGVCASPDEVWCICQVMLSHDFPVSYVCTVCIVSLCKQITELRARWRERETELGRGTISYSWNEYMLLNGLSVSPCYIALPRCIELYPFTCHESEPN